MTPRTTGALLSWMSVVTMLTQAFVLERAVRAVPPGALLRACLAAMALSLAGVGTAGGVAALSAWLVPLNVACVVAFTANSVALNGAAPPEDRGTLSALDMGTASAVRVVCPLLGAWLLGRCGFGGVAAASAAIMLALLIATSLGVGGNPGALAAKRAAAAAG